jgi:Ca-activated chloride channel family protein
VGIVNKDWVTEAHKQAANKYIDYLLERPQQREAMKFGFRPGDETIALDDEVFSLANGVDKEQPKRTFEFPRRTAMEGMIELWREQKKKTRLVLALDVSKSMDGLRIEKAKDAAIEMVKGLGEADTFSLLTFNHKTDILLKDVSLRNNGRDLVISRLRNLEAKGGTALYDAILEADKLSQGEGGAINAIILLSDGQDVSSDVDEKRMLRLLADPPKVAGRKYDPCQQMPLIFSIAYGEPTDDDPPNFELLEKLSLLSGAKYYGAVKKNGKYEGSITPQLVRKALNDVNAFFGARVIEQ